MSTIVLIRAGCTDYEDAHRLLGNLSVPLNARGTGQIREVVQRLQQQGLSPEVILTSPEDPACGTAHEVARAFPRLKVKELEEKLAAAAKAQEEANLRAQRMEEMMTQMMERLAATTTKK